MSAHTPGPWELETRHHVHAVVCKPTRKGEHPEVCFIEVSAFAFPGKPEGNLSAGSVTAQQRSREELRANARLVSAGPELLVACKLMLHWMLESDCETIDDFAKFDEALARAKAAISKAGPSLKLS